MAYKVAVVTEGDNNLINDISLYINNKLNSIGISSFLVADNNQNLTDEEKVNIIKQKYGTGNNIIVISNRLKQQPEDDAEIMYALRNNSKLASSIASNLEQVGLSVSKYYQLRNPSDTSLDNDYLIRNTKNNQTLAIYYSYFDDENAELISEAVVKAIANYAGINYTLNNNEGFYTVEKGDSLWSIASKNNTTVDNLKKLNNLTSNTLSIGQLLKLPSNNEDNAVDNNTYIVKKGDSLWNIANKYNTTVDNLKRLNNLSSNTLSIGQVLKIPEVLSANDKITYIVKKGDSLWSIANKYNTTVDKIKTTNNLSYNTLSIGQELVIPTTSNYINYTVQKGDSLWLIANKYNTTVDKLKRLNNLSSNLLNIGQVLLIEA